MQCFQTLDEEWESGERERPDPERGNLGIYAEYCQCETSSCTEDRFPMIETMCCNPDVIDPDDASLPLR